MPANAAASKVASLQNQRTMGFEEWIREYIESKPQKEITKNTESTVADSNHQDLASQSACMQASRQLDNQVPATDADAHHLSDSSQKTLSAITLKKTCHQMTLPKTAMRMIEYAG